MPSCRAVEDERHQEAEYAEKTRIRDIWRRNVEADRMAVLREDLAAWFNVLLGSQMAAETLFEVGFRSDHPMIGSPFY